MSVEFIPWPKTPRLFRECVITEKIDGTNAQIIIENGKAYAASRTRLITPEQDNYGFASWVRENEDTLINELGEGRHYGEWWGRGIQRGYNQSRKRFSLFNTNRWKNENLSVCEVVPVLYEGVFNQKEVDYYIEMLRNEGSTLETGFKAEGVIVYHKASNATFKVLCENDDRPKGE